MDGDAVEVRTPARADGYWVYARVLGKLPGTPDMTLSPGLDSLTYCDDTSGDCVLYLGYVTGGGFTTPEQTVYRAKGKNPAVPISNLFTWQGDVCYPVAPSAEYTQQTVCVDGQEIVGTPTLGSDGVTLICPAGTLMSLFCQYYETTWVFNVADFVSYFWNVDNNGTKLVQIRLYPR